MKNILIIHYYESDSRYTPFRFIPFHIIRGLISGPIMSISVLCAATVEATAHAQ
jgi:hypothetical protein